MSMLETVVAKIISEQELVIGPLAWSEAAKVHGLMVDIQKKEVRISDGYPTVTVDHLVARYERLFGPASREVCLDAAATLIKDMSPADIPTSLRASA